VRSETSTRMKKSGSSGIGGKEKRDSGFADLSLGCSRHQGRRRPCPRSSVLLSSAGGKATKSGRLKGSNGTRPRHGQRFGSSCIRSRPWEWFVAAAGSGAFAPTT
jgi:hypothetical protein